MSESKLPNVARAGVIMMVSLLLSRVLGMVRDMVMAAQFGKSAVTDAYFLSFQVPDLIFFLVAGGALSAAFIPVFSEYLHTGREDDAWQVFSAVTTVMATVLIVVISLAWVFAEPLTYLVAIDAPASSRPLIALMSQIVLPAQFAFFIGGLMFGTLYARQVFAVPGLGPNVYNVGIILGALLLSQFLTPGVLGMSWGALIGAVVGNLLIPAWAMRRLGSRFRVSFDLKHPGVRKVFRLMTPVVLGLSLPGVFALILQNMGTFYEQTGVNTALNYGNRLMQVPLGVFGQSLAIAAFPAFAQFFAQQRMDLFRDQLEKTLRQTIFLAVPASAVFIAIPEGVVRTLFQHGAWTAADTAVTAAGLRMFAIGIFAWCMHPVLMRAFFSVQRTTTPILIGTVTTGVFIGLGWAAIRLGLPYPMLALAGSLSAVFLVVAMLVAVRRVTPGIDLAGIGRTLAQTTLAAAVAGAAVYGASLLLPTDPAGIGKWASIAAVLGLCLGLAWLYYGLCRLMRMPETEYVRRAMSRLDSRSRRAAATDPADPSGPEGGR